MQQFYLQKFPKTVQLLGANTQTAGLTPALCLPVGHIPALSWLLPRGWRRRRMFSIPPPLPAVIPHLSLLSHLTLVSLLKFPLSRLKDRLLFVIKRSKSLSIRYILAPCTLQAISQCWRQKLKGYSSDFRIFVISVFFNVAIRYHDDEFIKEKRRGETIIHSTKIP